VECPHCGNVFKATAKLGMLRFRGFTCSACGRSFKRGLTIKLRLACWGLLGMTVWIWAKYPNNASFLALLFFSGMVLVDMFQLSKRHVKS
jgi:hypothetical protein